MKQCDEVLQKILWCFSQVRVRLHIESFIDNKFYPTFNLLFNAFFVHMFQLQLIIGLIRQNYVCFKNSIF